MKEELKRAFASPFFFLSFGFMFLCFLGYSFPAWIFSSGIEMEYRESAFQLSVGAIFFGSVMMFMPFCAAASHAVKQVDEIRSSMMQWRVLRGSVNQYAMIKMAGSAVSAACSTALAFGLHAVLWNIVALPVDPLVYPGHEIGWSETCLYAKWYLVCHGLPVYVEMTLGIAFSAAIWAIVALAVAVWIPDRLLVISVPSCIYYLWHLQLPYILFGINIPHPGTLYNDALTVEMAAECILTYLVVLLISISMYIAGLRRRACDA